MSEKIEMAEVIRHTVAQNIRLSRATGAPLTRRRPLPPIGLSGFGGAGKTAAATFLEEVYGMKRLHIAEPLRRMLASLLREYRYSDEMIARYLTGDLKESVIPEFGVTSRQMQISLGTEWGRVQISENIWSDLWGFQAPADAMNDSVRFPNEEDTVRKIGGYTILIVRPGTGPAAFKWKVVGPILYRWFGRLWGAHDSERTDRLKPDFVVVNDGSLNDLYKKLSAIIRTIRARG